MGFTSVLALCSRSHMYCNCNCGIFALRPTLETEGTSQNNHQSVSRCPQTDWNQKKCFQLATKKVSLVVDRSSFSSVYSLTQCVNAAHKISARHALGQTASKSRQQHSSLIGRHLCCKVVEWQRILIGVIPKRGFYLLLLHPRQGARRIVMSTASTEQRSSDRSRSTKTIPR